MPGIALVWVALLLIALSLCFAADDASAASDTDPTWLTDDEREWLAAHPVVRIGVDPGYAPYAFIDGSGRFQGVAADTLDLIAPMIGVRFELMRLQSWPAILDAARERRIDLITTAVQLPEREEFLAFSRIYIHTPLVVMTRAEMPTFASPDAIAGLRVALVDGYSSTRRVLQRYPGLSTLSVPDPVEGLIAVADGRADAYVGVLGVSLYQAQRHGLTNLKVNVGFDLRENGQRFAVRKDWAPLARILTKALDRIPESERQAILNHWLPTLRAAEASSPPQWSTTESQWLARHHEVRVGVEDDQAPFSFIDRQGRPAGLLVDMLEELRRRAGLRLRWVGGSADDLVRRWREGELDMLLIQRAVAQREPGLIATQPLYQSSYMLVCRRSTDCSEGLSSFDGRAVAVRQGGFAHDHALLRPQVRLVTRSTVHDALQALQAGDVDAVLGEARSLHRAFETAPAPFTGLKVGGTFGDGAVRLQMGVRSDWPELASILNRALAAVPPDQFGALRAHWLSPTPPPAGFDRARVLRIAGIASAIVLVFLGTLAWTNRRLRREIAWRREIERHLAEARDAAEAASRHKSDFVRNTSHELRTPLNAIIGMLNLLERTPLDARQSQYLQIQSKATQGLLDLVNDLLDLARMESGRLALRHAPFDLRRLLDDSQAIVRETAQRKGLALGADIDEGVPDTVSGDASRLQQVLVNLLANAVKYTAAGEVRLEVRQLASPDPLRVNLSFAIVDTGPGIAPEHQQQIFLPFQQGGRSSADAAHGVGLGLSIAFQLVQYMGGTLAVSSRIGEGSRFHFTLDLALAEASELSTPAAAGAEPGAMRQSPGWRVLLVEDNEVNRLIAREVLRARGCEVHEAVDGTQALSSLASEPAFDLVLMDVGLPDIDGLEVTRRLRALPGAAAAVPVIGLTARALLREREDCLRAGMQQVVLKPFAPDELWDCMQQVMAARKASRHPQVA